MSKSITWILLMAFLTCSFVYPEPANAIQGNETIRKKIVIASGGSEITSFSNAYEQAQLMLEEALSGKQPVTYELRLFTAKNLEELTYVQKLAQEAKDADVVFLDRISNYNLPQIITALKKADLPPTVLQQFNQKADPETLKKQLGGANEEITNLLKALRGEYIQVSPGGDPIRKSEVLPTGRNLIAVDPSTLPDKAAWEIGKKAADQLVSNYQQEKGRYPESVATVVWSYETMSSNGQSVAMILRLLGAEPRWDGGKVVGH